MASQRNAVGRLFKSSTAFFLCDIQEKFIPRLQYAPGILAHANLLVKGSKIMGCPLIVTEQYPRGLGKTAPEIALPANSKVFEKTKFSMLTNEVQSELATHKGIRDIVLFGLEAHVCVLQTAMDLIEQGYVVHVASDGVASIRGSDRMVAFERMRQMGVFVSTTESLLFQLLGDATDESFKEISNLLKEPRPDAGLIPAGRL